MASFEDATFDSIRIEALQNHYIKYLADFKTNRKMCWYSQPDITGLSMPMQYGHKITPLERRLGGLLRRTDDSGKWMRSIGRSDQKEIPILAVEQTARVFVDAMVAVKGKTMRKKDFCSNFSKQYDGIRFEDATFLFDALNQINQNFKKSRPSSRDGNIFITEEKPSKINENTIPKSTTTEKAAKPQALVSTGHAGALHEQGNIDVKTSQSSNTPSIFCLNYQQQGHIAADCTSKQSRSNSQSGALQNADTSKAPHPKIPTGPKSDKIHYRQDAMRPIIQPPAPNSNIRPASKDGNIGGRHSRDATKLATHSSVPQTNERAGLKEAGKLGGDDNATHLIESYIEWTGNEGGTYMPMTPAQRKAQIKYCKEKNLCVRCERPAHVYSTCPEKQVIEGGNGRTLGSLAREIRNLTHPELIGLYELLDRQVTNQDRKNIASGILRDKNDVKKVTAMQAKDRARAVVYAKATAEQKRLEKLEDEVAAKERDERKVQAKIQAIKPKPTVAPGTVPKRKQSPQPESASKKPRESTRGIRQLEHYDDPDDRPSKQAYGLTVGQWRDHFNNV